MTKQTAPRLKIVVDDEIIVMAKPISCPVDMDLENINCPECKTKLAIMNIEIIQHGFVWDKHLNTFKCEQCRQGYYTVYEIAFVEGEF